MLKYLFGIRAAQRDRPWRTYGEKIEGYPLERDMGTVSPTPPKPSGACNPSRPVRGPALAECSQSFKLLIKPDTDKSKN